MLKSAIASLLFAACSLAQASPDWVSATVVKTDAERQRITLKHGPIDNLDMPPMTMAFKAASPQWYTLVPTQSVRVKVEKVDGLYTITALEPGPVPAGARN